MSDAAQAQFNCFSFEFKGCLLTNALEQIGRDAGINILVPLDVLEGQKINRSYKNLEIETIITNMFHGKNYAIVWNYQKEHLVYVQIQLVESNGSNHPLKYHTFDGQSGSNDIRKNQTGKKLPGACQPLNRGLQNYNNKDNNKGVSRPPTPDPERFKGLELPPMPPVERDGSNYPPKYHTFDGPSGSNDIRKNQTGKKLPDVRKPLNRGLQNDTNKDNYQGVSRPPALGPESVIRPESPPMPPGISSE